MKTTTLALVASLLVASGMCNFEVHKIPAVESKSIKQHSVKRNDGTGDDLIWNQDDSAYCTDNSMCGGFCQWVHDWLTLNPHAEGCSQDNICHCWSTDPKATCESYLGMKTVDACARGGSPLDRDSDASAYCVVGCNPTNEPSEKDNGGNGLCTYKQDPCLLP